MFGCAKGWNWNLPSNPLPSSFIGALSPVAEGSGLATRRRGAWWWRGAVVAVLGLVVMGSGAQPGDGGTVGRVREAHGPMTKGRPAGEGEEARGAVPGAGGDEGLGGEGCGGGVARV